MEFLSGINIICFAASYAVTLILEITRLFFRSGIRGAVMLGFAGAGLFAHTVYLYYRAIGAPGSPLSSKQDWYMVAAWVLVVTYLYLIYYLVVLAWACFVANLDVAYRVLHLGLPIRPAIVKVRTTLKSDVAKFVLANSITLTPGTLTVDIVGQDLYIHWINTITDSPQLRTELIAGRFEEILKRIFD